MEEDDLFYPDEFEEIDRAILNRATSRLSELLPKRLRFSEAAWAQRAAREENAKKAGAAAGAAPAAAALARKGTFQGSTKSGGSCSLKVYVRVRPMSVRANGQASKAEESIKATAGSETEVTLYPPQNAKRVPGLKQLPTEQYSFTRVFGPSTTQETYFDGTAGPLVEDLLAFKARCSVVMAYGSSGAGKTYSIEGSPDNPGVLPRTLQAIFAKAKGMDKAPKVLVSYFELYNDLVFDLLEASGAEGATTGQNQQQQQQAQQQGAGRQMDGGPGALKHVLLQPAPTGRRTLRVREDARGRVVIPGLSEVLCTSAEQAVEMQRRAAKLRQQAATGVNSTSSRSHCVFTIKLVDGPGLQQAPAPGPAVGAKRPAAALKPQVQPGQRVAQLSFVDLAGSERAGRTNNTGDRFKESVSINNSLMTLGRCLEVLKANQSAPPGAAQRMIPFRESKITHLFKDVLHGWGHLVLAVSVSPSAADYEESHHCLRYAALATSISLAVAEAAPEPEAAAAAAPAVPSLKLPTGRASGGAAQQPSGRASAGGSLSARGGGNSSARGGRGAAGADSAALAVRVAELEAELAKVRKALTEAEAALGEAEADIRDEVVSEIQDVIRELRGSYEERLADMEEQLRLKDERIDALTAELAAAQAALTAQPAAVAQPASAAVDAPAQAAQAAASAAAAAPAQEPVPVEPEQQAGQGAGPATEEAAQAGAEGETAGPAKKAKKAKKKRASTVQEEAQQAEQEAVQPQEGAQQDAVMDPEQPAACAEATAPEAEAGAAAAADGKKKSKRKHDKAKRASAAAAAAEAEAGVQEEQGSAVGGPDGMEVDAGPAPLGDATNKKQQATDAGAADAAGASDQGAAEKGKEKGRKRGRKGAAAATGTESSEDQEGGAPVGPKEGAEMQEDAAGQENEGVAASGKASKRARAAEKAAAVLTSPVAEEVSAGEGGRKGRRKAK